MEEVSETDWKNGSEGLEEQFLGVRCETPQVEDSNSDSDSDYNRSSSPLDPNFGFSGGNRTEDKVGMGPGVGTPEGFVAIQIDDNSPHLISPHKNIVPAFPTEISVFHPNSTSLSKPPSKSSPHMKHASEDLFDLELNDEVLEKKKEVEHEKVPKVNVSADDSSLKKLKGGINEVFSKSEGNLRLGMSDSYESLRDSRENLLGKSQSRGDGHRSERGEIQLMKLSLLEANSAEKIIADKKKLRKTLEEHSCYSLIPESSKMVVLDTQLPVTHALRALEENNIKSAPLWDEEKMDFVGIITVTDFIEILLRFHKQPHLNIFKELQQHKIFTWKDIIWGENNQPPLIWVHPDDSLMDACQILLKHRIHRLPVIDREESNTILHIITHYRMLAFIQEKLEEKPAISTFSVESLGIGTYKNVVTVFKDTPLHVVLTTLAEGRISAVPVIDENGEVVDVYSKSDVIFLIKQVSENFLHESVGQILEYKQKAPFHTCSKKDSLGPILSKLVKTRCHRLICVDSTNRIEGVISLSDILQYFVEIK
eukprot:TRINITY_DN2676_c0_g1_i1.p1 TRINITY_DN2676_c0_g1~~TRINITY_DN2676_c0_g1_i1.p1  ORF type:complete len:538 (-),score=154.97 TRINITY_DN2676_c0_g1_i1:14-1627(-)